MVPERRFATLKREFYKNYNFEFFYYKSVKIKVELNK